MPTKAVPPHPRPNRTRRRHLAALVDPDDFGTAGVAAAFVSEWFVDALTPAIAALNISEAFAGLVVVAIAGNAVENVVGIQLAMQNKGDLAVSVVLNSSLQVAIALTPILVIISSFVGTTPLTLQLPPLLVATLVLAVLLDTVIVLDGGRTGWKGRADWAVCHYCDFVLVGLIFGEG
ncbi:MAG: hypothetical protein R2932_06830 [Caldilineaceae bacterium]